MFKSRYAYMSDIVYCVSEGCIYVVSLDVVCNEPSDGVRYAVVYELMNIYSVSNILIMSRARVVLRVGG